MHFTHILFSIVFAVAYCVVAEKFPKITLWQGVAAGILVNIAVHVITLPILGLTPPLLTLPWYEHVSEFARHALYLVYRAYEARFAKSYHARA
ncbi:MAG: DUF1440 domain-containing protein [Campylobacter sp.]|uniref:DUF1440 domain-containing protein n=1 Tax=Campylobacter sp. TaxID=205 RepID=UPI00360D74C8